MTTSTSQLVPEAIATTLTDPAAYADERIYEAYRWLREHQPLGLAAPTGFRPFWVLTRHADILAVSRNNDVFSNAEGQLLFMSEESDRRIRAATGGSPHIGRSLVQMDGAEHRAYRKLTQAWFMPAQLRRSEEVVRETARQAAKTLLASGGRSDFVKDVALLYPLRVILQLIGVPEADTARVLRMTQEIFSPRDPDVFRESATDSEDAHSATLLAATAEMRAYFGDLTRNRRANPRDDLASIIVNGEVLGEPITDWAINAYFTILATAGHDTTSSSISMAMFALASDPALFAEVKDDMSLLPKLAEESIRYATPVKTFMRTATQDVEMAGQHIAKGDWLMLCYASGNRDEAVFNHPDKFDIHRPLQKQIAFGYGSHVCLGQHLARLEMTTLLQELLPKLSSLALDGEPAMINSFFVNGLKRLPIRFEQSSAELAAYGR